MLPIRPEEGWLARCIPAFAAATSRNREDADLSSVAGASSARVSATRGLRVSKERDSPVVFKKGSENRSGGGEGNRRGRDHIFPYSGATAVTVIVGIAL